MGQNILQIVIKILGSYRTINNAQFTSSATFLATLPNFLNIPEIPI
jgi:hypothetical protein